MAWIKLGSLFFFIILVIFLTLGGREFFEYFDVEITKKNSTETVSAPDQQSSDKQENDGAETKKSKSQEDDPWARYD
jgi:hypothetical protein